MAKRSFLIAIAGALTVLLQAPGPAWAQRCPGAVPPGNPQVDQYVETVPGDCGDRQVNPPGGSGGGDAGGPSGAAVPTGTAAQLESFGPEGEQAASVAELTAPGAPPSGDRDQGRGAGDAEDGAEQVSAGVDGFSIGSFLAGLASALGGGSGGDGGGLGVALPILSGLVALLGAGYLLRDRILR